MICLKAQKVAFVNIDPLKFQNQKYIFLNAKFTFNNKSKTI